MSAIDPIVAALVVRRRQLGMSQDAVAGRLRICRTALSMRENGHRTQGLAELREWAAVLGYDLVLAPHAARPVEDIGDTGGRL